MQGLPWYFRMMVHWFLVIYLKYFFIKIFYLNKILQRIFSKLNWIFSSEIYIYLDSSIFSKRLYYANSKTVLSKWIELPINPYSYIFSRHFYFANNQSVLNAYIKSCFFWSIHLTRFLYIFKTHLLWLQAKPFKAHGLSLFFWNIYPPRFLYFFNTLLLCLRAKLFWPFLLKYIFTQIFIFFHDTCTMLTT